MASAKSICKYSTWDIKRSYNKIKVKILDRCKNKPDKMCNTCEQINANETRYYLRTYLLFLHNFLGHFFRDTSNQHIFAWKRIKMTTRFSFHQYAIPMRASTWKPSQDILFHAHSALLKIFYILVIVYQFIKQLRLTIFLHLSLETN